MNDAPIVTTEPGLSEPSRIINTFFAPSKTFTDIKRNAMWWGPLLIVLIFSAAYVYVLQHKVGIPGLVDGMISHNPGLQQRIQDADPATAAKIRESMAGQFKFMWFAPIFVLLIAAIVSGIFLATTNFVFGGRAKYKEVLAVWFYGALPLNFISILTIILVAAGVGVDNFNIKNAVGTNLGYFLESSVPHALMPLLNSMDVFAIWVAILLTIGLSTVAGIKRSQAAITVFGWWFIYVLLQTGMAAIGLG